MKTKNFDDSEFTCHCGKCSFSQPFSGIVKDRLMIALQMVRDAYGMPIIVTSGRRCHTHNLEVGGVADSYHTQGMAADVKGADMSRLLSCLLQVPDLHYIEPHDGYIHVDIGKMRKHRVNDLRTSRRKLRGMLDA